MLRHTCALFVMLTMLPRVPGFYRTSNCLDRCEFEIRSTDALVVHAEDILSFQRFFDPSLLGPAAQEVTSLHVICSKSLLGETVTAFQDLWAPLASRILRLHIQRCRIMSFAPQAFRQFECLTSLIVDNHNEGSPFMTSRGGLEGLPNLASFTLSKVRLRHIDRGLFQNASKHNLLKVYLSHNYLTKVDVHTFCGMRRLSDLDLSCNRLSGSKVDFLACAPSLYLFNISHNSIHELERSPFSRNPMLHVLDLSYNNFTSIGTIVSIVNETKSLRELYISGNPFACNLTALSQLHHLAGHADLHIMDWERTKCFQDDEWTSVQDLLFPYGFSRLFRIWHVAIVVVVFLVCFCCCGALKFHADHPEVSSHTALWQVIQRYFVGAVARRHEGEMESKLPQTNTCISIIQCSEAEIGPKYEQVIEEIKQKKSISETADGGVTRVDVATQSPFAMKRDVESNEDIAIVSHCEETQEVTQSTYISYKTHLEPDQRDTERPPYQELHCNGPEALNGGPHRGEGAISRGTHMAQRREEEYSEGSDNDLPLFTSAGVATTPTETQTVAMAGVRSVTQYTLESWLTVEPPHVLAPPAPEPPTPLQLLAAKMRHQTPAGTFTLHSPPLQTKGDREDVARRLSKGRALQGSAKHSPVKMAAARPPITRQEHPLQQHLLTPRDKPTTPETTGMIWQTDVQAAPVGDEHLVCRSCLEALSLPDVHSPSAMLNGTAHRWSQPLQPSGPRGRTSASLRRPRISHSTSVEADGQTFPAEKANLGAGKQTSFDEKPVYRSLERATRRGPHVAPARVTDNHHRQPPSPLADVGASSLTDPHVASPHLERIDEQHFRVKTAAVSSLSSLPPSHRTSGGESVGKNAAGPSGGPPPPPENGGGVSLSEISPSPETAATTSGQCPAPASGSGEECSCRCETHLPPKVKAQSSDGGDTTGDEEHCEIDIETQATQIIDMVELHAQSSCNPS